ncbi:MULTISPECIES: hypothetical protein [Microbacterium]|jgi:membrane protein YdbS with pleckstrin-like domain|uniref:hypothetical protein n=1 Tax=Microbacterium TaxID=33882 RepID=UPI000D01A337|nr:MULTISPECIES: hypothetical protein [Microbacterium]AVL98591.1 hypothetical protein C6C15_16650 [Microbacterium sp. str. 'China']MCK2033205.1 hypothetical protein [Microbacterium sp. KSW4-4]MCT2224493.1 hypothetical protein [Microbacterium paraoxydans]
MTLHSGRWIASATLLIVAIAVLILRMQGLISDTASSILMAALLAIAIAVGIAMSIRRHRRSRSRTHSD